MSMITIATYYNIVDAELAKSRLEDNGIQAFVADEASYLIGYGAVIGGVRLQVPDEDVERAKAILAARTTMVLPNDPEMQADVTPDESLHVMDEVEIKAAWRKVFRAIRNLLRYPRT